MGWVDKWEQWETALNYDLASLLMHLEEKGKLKIEKWEVTLSKNLKM